MRKTQTPSLTTMMEKMAVMLRMRTMRGTLDQKGNRKI